MSWFKNNRLLIQTALFIGLFFFVVTRIPKEIDWSTSYAHMDERPYGAKILYDRLGDIFTQEIEVAYLPIYEMFTTDSLDHLAPENLIIITDYLQLDSASMEQLLDYVAGGSEVFIAAGTLPYSLLDTLRLESQYRRNLNDFGVLKEAFTMSYHDPAKNADSSYVFKASSDPASLYSSSLVSDARAIGSRDIASGDDGDYTVHVKKPYGAGHFYFHSYPQAFTNYHLLKQPDEQYIANALAYMPDRRTIWNSFYKPNKIGRGKDSLHVIKDLAGTRWAFYLLIAGVLFYTIFNLKRKQRIIPVVKPPRNIREDYIKTIANLHMEESNNTAIAKKKIKFFTDYLFRNLGMKDISFSEEDAIYVAKRTGKEEETVRKLFKNIQSIEAEVHISDYRLDRLSKYINYIYGHTDVPTTKKST